MRKLSFTVALAAAAVASFAQSGMMSPDAKSSKPKELMSFIDKDAYKKLNAADAYILTEFLGDLPGNYQTAVLRGLVRIANEAESIKAKNQTAANAMAPMGDTMPEYKSSYKNFQQGDRSFEAVTMDPMSRVSYWDTLKLLQISQDETDRGLIQTLFTMKSFTRDPLMSPWNERELDALERYVKALAKSTEPVRLKYVSLAPHTYAGLPSGWSGLPWPNGS